MYPLLKESRRTQGVQNDSVHHRPTQGETGPGAEGIRNKAGFRPKHHETGTRPVRCHGQDASRNAG